jgi:uncharacterized protein
MTTLQSFRAHAPSDVAPYTDDLSGWVKTKGAPTMRTWVLHASPDGKMKSGAWEATPGTYHATYTAFEFVHLISGRIVITPDGGTPTTVVAGDAFVVEKDFKGTWEIKEHALKHWTFRVEG